MTKEELEKENEELKAKNKWYSEQICNKECKEVWGQVEELQKENAELKERLKEHESVGNSQFWKNVWSWKTKAIQLTKAKEIIKKFSEFANLEVEYDPEHPQKHTDLWNELCKDAEQFLNGGINEQES